MMDVEPMTANDIMFELKRQRPASAHSSKASLGSSPAASRPRTRPTTAVQATRSSGAALSSSPSTTALQLAIPVGSPAAGLSPETRAKAFVDPVGVGAFLASEARASRVNAAHKQALDRARRTEDDSGSDDDHILPGDDSAAGGSSKSAKKKHHGRYDSAPTVIKLNRRMQGVLTEDFFGCLRATEREVGDAPDPAGVEAFNKSEAELNAATGATTRDEAKSKREGAKSSRDGGDAAATGPVIPMGKLLHDAGPLTRALHAKRLAAAQAAAYQEEKRKQAHLRKLRPNGRINHNEEGNGPAWVNRLEDAELARLAAEKQARNRNPARRSRGGDIDRDIEEDAPDADDPLAHHKLCMPHICVPPTITYRKGMAVAWYFSSSVDGSVKRKHARHLTTKRIIACMNAIAFKTPWQSERPIDIAAVFYHSESHLPPLYLSQADMQRFVLEEAMRGRHSGVLQKFVPPQAEHNSMLRVTWTPSMCMVERRTSNNKLDAVRLRLEERVATYEIATGLGVEVREEAVHDTSSLRTLLQDTCASIAEHFTIVAGQTVAAAQGRAANMAVNHAARACRPIKMQIYFKMAGQHQLFMLLCDELRWSKIESEDLSVTMSGGTQKTAASSSIPQQLAVAWTPSAASLHSSQSSSQLIVRRSKKDDKHKLLSSASEAILDTFIVRRREIDSVSRAHSKSVRASEAAAASASSQQPQRQIAAWERIPGPLGRREKRGALRCGHCAVTLNASNSTLSSAALASISASSLVGVPPEDVADLSSTKPYLDLHTVLLYRLTLCLHLLPAAPPPGSNFPPAHWTNLQTIRSAFFWNLARAILVPAYMDDEKEWKVHLYHFEAGRLHRHQEAVKRAEIRAGKYVSGSGAQSRAMKEAAEEQAAHAGDDDEILLASPSATAVGRAEVRRGGASQPAVVGAPMDPTHPPQPEPLTIWDTRIFLCRSCGADIRAARRNWMQPTTAQPDGTTVQQGPSPLLGVFDTLLDAYIEHERLRDQLPPNTSSSKTRLDEIDSGAQWSPSNAAHSPRTIAAHARSLARMQGGPEAGLVASKPLPPSGAPGASIYLGPPLRSPNPGVPLPETLPPPPGVDSDGTLSWPVHSRTSASPIQVAFGGSTSHGGRDLEFTFTESGASGSAHDPLAAWSQGAEATGGEAVRALLQEDALRPNARTTSMLAELTAAMLADGPGHKLTRQEREAARASRESTRESRRTRQTTAELEAARERRRKFVASDTSFKRRLYGDVKSRLHGSPTRGGENGGPEESGSGSGSGSDSSDLDLAELLLEHGADQNPEDSDGAEGALSRTHHRILSYLSRIDPAHARILKARTEAGGGKLDEQSWQRDKKEARRVARALRRSSDHPERLEQEAADQSEAQRVRAQLMAWARRQAAKELAARVKTAEAEALRGGRGSRSPSRSRSRSRSHSRSMSRSASAGRFRPASAVSDLLPSTAADDEDDPFYVAASNVPREFGAAPLSPPQHHLKFKTYRAAPAFDAAAEDNAANFGAASPSAANTGANTPATRGPVESSTRSAHRRGASASPSPPAARRTRPSSATSPMRHLHRSPSLDSDDFDTFASPPARSKKALPARSWSAQVRRPAATAAAASDQSSFASTQTLPTQVSSPARTRVSSAVAARRATGGDASSGPPPFSGHSSGSPAPSSSAQQILTFGYDNAAAFATGSNPYMEPSHAGRLRGYVPAGFDPAKQESYPSRFGPTAFAGKKGSSTKKQKPRPASAATKHVKQLSRAAILDAEAKAIGRDEAREQQQREAEAEAQAEADAAEAEAVAAEAAAAIAASPPPKSLAVFASPESVGIRAAASPATAASPAAAVRRSPPTPAARSRPSSAFTASHSPAYYRSHARSSSATHARTHSASSSASRPVQRSPAAASRHHVAEEADDEIRDDPIYSSGEEGDEEEKHAPRRSAYAQSNSAADDALIAEAEKKLFSMGF